MARKRSERQIRHRDGCPKPEPRRHVSPRGACVEKCPSCGRYAIIAGPGEEPPPPPPSPRPRGPRHFCRDHLEPVDANGKGCEQCADDRATRRPHSQPRFKDEGDET